jgi:signal peptidase I
MSRGVQSLALISATAALIGFLSTVLGIMNSFQSMGASKTTAMAATADRLSQAMTPGLLGLLVAILALWFHRYLNNDLEAFDLEMKNASVDLVNRLVVHLERLRTVNPTLWAALIIGVERPAVAPQLPSKSQSEAPRFLLQRIYRHGVLELIWPRIESEFDVKIILDAAGRLCFAYGILGWFTYWLQGRFTTGFMMLAFFAVAAAAVRRGSRVTLIAACSFLSATAVALLFSHAYFLEPLSLLAAALLLNGSWRALQWSRGVNSTQPRLRRLWTPVPIALAISLSIGILFTTLLGLFHTGPYDDSMEPTIPDRGWELGVNASVAGPIQRGQVWQVEMGRPGVVRVVGLPGDRVRIKNGVLILNGEPIREPYLDPYLDPGGDFPLPPESYSDVFLRVDRELSYDLHLNNNTDYIVPHNSYFVLNDHRAALSDSRTMGPVRRDQLIARLLFAFNANVSGFWFHSLL